MNLFETIRTAYAAGVEVWFDGGPLRYRSPGPLSAELKANLTAHKPAVTALLVTFCVSQVDDYGNCDEVQSAPRRYPTSPGCIAEGACLRLGWCERARGSRCCDSVRGAAASVDSREAT